MSKIDSYRQDVYDLLTRVPQGKVVTYGIIAKFLRMSTPRMVGKILHQNTNPKLYPCHRVVFSSGVLAKGYVFGGEGKQRERLEEEGVTFIENKVDLKKHMFFFE